MISRLVCVVSCCLALCCTVCGAEKAAKLSVAVIFGDHMVLQSGRQVPVWGTAEPGAEVTVKIADTNATAKAGQDGKWTVKIGPFKAGGPHEMTVSDGKTAVTFKDVLIGEVWFCSGQSNMVMPVSFELKEIADKEIPAAIHPRLRLRSRVWGGKWEACTPETAAPFPGTAYFFGRDLHIALKVPVGLIVEAQGGTPIETYMSREAVAAAALPDKKGMAERAGNRNIDLLIPYGIAGAIFYQGEGGSGANRYDICLTEMVKDWRAKWGQGDFPFLNVQISGSTTPFKERPKAGSGTSSALNVQHYQFQGLMMPNSGLATAADRGVSEVCEAGRHPKNKRELGRRLSLIARSIAYGDKGAIGTPLPQSLTITGKTAKLVFSNAGTGLKALGSDTGEVIGFAASSSDGKNCRWADAKIVGTNTVEIACPPGLSKIEKVYYAPGGELMGCNLYNSENIAAPIFAVDEEWLRQYETRRK